MKILLLPIILKLMISIECLGRSILQWEQYGIPLDYHPMAVYKNADMYTAAGIDPNITWNNMDSFIDSMQKTTKDGFRLPLVSTILIPCVIGMAVIPARRWSFLE